MKINLIYENQLISTKLNSTIRVKDLLHNVRSDSKLELFTPKSEIKIMDDTMKILPDSEIIQCDPKSERKFYLLCHKDLRETTVSDQMTQETEELIMQVTGAKAKIKKKQPSSNRRFNDRNFLDFIANNMNNIQVNVPGGQNRINEISQLTNLLRNVVGDQYGGDPLFQLGVGRPGGSQPTNVTPDENHVRTLKEMGFPEDRCRRALMMSRNNISRATDMLLNDELDYVQDESNNNQGEEVDALMEEEMLAGENGDEQANHHQMQFSVNYLNPGENNNSVNNVVNFDIDMSEPNSQISNNQSNNEDGNNNQDHNNDSSNQG